MPTTKPSINILEGNTNNFNTNLFVKTGLMFIYIILFCHKDIQCVNEIVQNLLKRDSGAHIQQPLRWGQQ